MPFTPYHFGPGTLFKSLFPHYFSLTIFIFCQGVMDTEPLFFMITGQPPYHRLFHTYLGALIPLVLSVLFGPPVCNAFLKFWTKVHESTHSKPPINRPAVWSGAMIGAYSHVFLDSMMHADIYPFLPFSDRSPMLGIVNYRTLILFCHASGLVGIGILFILFLPRRPHV